MMSALWLYGWFQSSYPVLCCMCSELHPVLQYIPFILCSAKKREMQYQEIALMSECVSSFGENQQQLLTLQFQVLFVPHPAFPYQCTAVPTQALQLVNNRCHTAHHQHWNQRAEFVTLKLMQYIKLSKLHLSLASKTHTRNCILYWNSNNRLCKYNRQIFHMCSKSIPIKVAYRSITSLKHFIASSTQDMALKITPCSMVTTQKSST